MATLFKVVNKSATILIALLCFACSTKRNKPIESTNFQTTEIAQDVLKKTKVSLHNFSSSEKKDTFLLVLTGNSIKHATIIFKIISWDYGIIHDEKFDAMALYGYGPKKQNPDSLEIETHLIERFENFFNDKNFLTPAIKSDATYDLIYSDLISEDEWVKIKGNASSIGFIYYLWEESISWIVFSKEKGKAIVYQTCC